MPITKEGQERAEALWAELSRDDLKADDVMKLATDDVVGDFVTDGVFYDSRPPVGYVFQAGHFKIASPKSGEEVADGITKLAGFWQEAFSNLSGTLKNVVRGGGKKVDPIQWKELSRFVDAATDKVDISGMKAFVNRANQAVEETGTTGYQKMQMGLAGALVATPVAFGAAEAHDAFKKHQYSVVLDHLQKDPAFENVSDAAKVKEAYHLMVKYSPSIALDPVVSKSFVMLIVSHPDSANVETIGNLMDAERRFKESNDFTGAFSDRVRRLMRHPLAEPFTGGGGGKK